MVDKAYLDRVDIFNNEVRGSVHKGLGEKSYIKFVLRPIGQSRTYVEFFVSSLRGTELDYGKNLDCIEKIAAALVALNKFYMKVPAAYLREEVFRKKEYGHTAAYLPYDIPHSRYTHMMGRYKLYNYEMDLPKVRTD